jgi:hypothetical protein
MKKMKRFSTPKELNIYRDYWNRRFPYAVLVII